jgi:hypothetical protein
MGGLERGMMSCTRRYRCWICRWWSLGTFTIHSDGVWLKGILLDYYEKRLDLESHLWLRLGIHFGLPQDRVSIRLEPTSMHTSC